MVILFIALEHLESRFINRWQQAKLFLLEFYRNSCVYGQTLWKVHCLFFALGPQIYLEDLAELFDASLQLAYCFILALPLYDVSKFFRLKW